THRGQMGDALNNLTNAQAEGMPFDPRELGFDFSYDDVIAYSDTIRRKGLVQRGAFYSDKKKKAA
ncbi:MAG: hypothetical protein WA324_28835, partial [Bryobacteraceae bacterium]